MDMSSTQVKRVYSGAIVARFMDESAIRSLNQQYEDHKLKKSGRGLREVTSQDLRVYDFYQETKKKNQYLPMRELARRFGRSEGQVRTSLLLAALAKVDR